LGEGFHLFPFPRHSTNRPARNAPRGLVQKLLREAKSTISAQSGRRLSRIGL
jgi:hypothetical protein